MTAATPDNVINIHREISIQFLKSSAGFAIRTPIGQKDPGSVNWDPKSNSRERSNETIQTISSTNDNLGIHLFGQTIDVDIDSDNPVLMAALDHFMPRTNHIWGRKSRPRTHRLYELAGANATFDPTEFPFLNKIKSTPDIALELRGGEMKSGQYTLLPGSIHPSGEAYEWTDMKAARSTPVQIGLDRIIDAVRFAAVTALIVPYWTEGMRNELCKALCGFMFRASVCSVEIDVGIPFDKDKAKLILDGIMEVAEDDPTDRGARIKTLEHTWEKGLSGSAVIGATRLVEITGRDDLLSLLYTLLAYTPDLIELEKLFDQYAVLRNTTNVIDLNLGARGNYIMNKDAFIFTLAGRYLTSPKGRVPLSNVFINSLQRVIVDRVGMDPSQPKVFEDKEGFKLANVWSGWGIDPSESATEADVQPFLEYLRKVVADDKDEIFQWVLMWLADIFQNTSSKSGTALVLVGKQGSGKTFLFEKILRPIIGDAHFSKAGTTERLTSKFNAHLGGKLFVQGEEVVNSNRRVDAEALKDAITSSKRTIEFKGRDSFEMDDYARYGFTSNHVDNAIHIGTGDRRFTVIHVNEKHAHYDNGFNDIERTQFWQEMHRWAESSYNEPHRENLANLHRYLLDVKVDRATIRKPLETKAKQDMRQTSSRGMDAWLQSMIELTSPFDSLREHDRESGHSYTQNAKGEYHATDEWPTHVTYAKLEQAMKTFTARDYGEARSAQQIAKFFKEKGLIDSTEEIKVRFAGRRMRCRPFPSRASITRYLVEQGYNVLDLSSDDAGTKDRIDF